MHTKKLKMEQTTLTIIGWFSANMVSLYIGIKAKTFCLMSLFGGIKIETIKDCITILGGVSTIALIIYMIEKTSLSRLKKKILKLQNKDLLKKQNHAKDSNDN